MSLFVKKYFAYSHLPEHLQKVSKPFGELAVLIENELSHSNECAPALRKLLEAKDCAVRAALDPKPKPWVNKYGRGDS